MHITSLPSRFGIGDLGPEAYRFADTLVEAGQTIWQVLPIVPVGFGYSPYASPSTFAGNPHLISPDLLIRDGLLTKKDVGDLPVFPLQNVDFHRVLPHKNRLIKVAFDRFSSLGADHDLKKSYSEFVGRNQSWLDDFSMFEALKTGHHNVEWTYWEKGYALREDDAMEIVRSRFAGEIGFSRFSQFLFDRQWSELKQYCNERGIRIFGDLPIYVAQDSADVWAHPELFRLDETGRAVVVSGVPPDYFSETGQRWGNPIYRWDRMKENGFAWWTARFGRILELVDLVRLDHFRGFEAYWEVPASEETAMHGRWVRGPGMELFEILQDNLGSIPVVAENLGVITDGVTELMQRFDFPGMAILQFAFDGNSSNEFLPHNYDRALVAYTGTHDNDTFRGWWKDTVSTQDADVIEHAHKYCKAYLGIDDANLSDLHWAAIRSLMASVANIVVTPMQDVLGLGGEARMNLPGTVADNWNWRMEPSELTEDLVERLRLLTETFGRIPA
jgi:4-alpha-glucanotransferase